MNTRAYQFPSTYSCWQCKKSRLALPPVLPLAMQTIILISALSEIMTELDRVSSAWNAPNATGCTAQQLDKRHRQYNNGKDQNYTTQVLGITI